MAKIRSVSEKMGIRNGSRTLLVKVPEDAHAALDLPDLKLSSRMTGNFDYIHLFAEDQQMLHNYFSRLKKHLATTGMLWISWPKSGKNGTDLNIKNVIKIGYDYGLVESKALSVNETWSALKFTHPKEGKSYNNSYGKLKGEKSHS
jgi:hypothetical protein